MHLECETPQKLALHCRYLLPHICSNSSCVDPKFRVTDADSLYLLPVAGNCPLRAHAGPGLGIRILGLTRCRSDLKVLEVGLGTMGATNPMTKIVGGSKEPDSGIT